MAEELKENESNLIGSRATLSSILTPLRLHAGRNANNNHNE